MQVQDANSENEQVGAGWMRTENGNDSQMAQALSQDCKDTVLSPGRNEVDSDSDCKSSVKVCTVAVTTAPRKDCTLEFCLASIEVCGWDPIVFAEPGSTRTDYRTIENEARLGIWHNWLASCRWCLEQSSRPYIMTVQDDSLFHPDSKSFIDAMQWPDNAGFVSLYTPKHYSLPGKSRRLRSVGINRIATKSLWGACALLWQRATLERVIETPTCKYWLGARPKSGNTQVIERRREHPSTIANSDTAIGKAVNRLGLDMYFIDPSPVQHVARYSTISHGDNTGRRNCGRCADFDLPLKEQVFP